MAQFFGWAKAWAAVLPAQARRQLASRGFRATTIRLRDALRPWRRLMAGAITGRASAAQEFAAVAGCRQVRAGIVVAAFGKARHANPTADVWVALEIEPC